MTTQTEIADFISVCLTGGKQPDFYDDHTKMSWYLDDGMTAYCTKWMANGNPPLKNARVYLVIDEEQFCEYVLVDTEKKTVLDRATSIDGIGCKIDIWRSLRRANDRHD